MVKEKVPIYLKFSLASLRVRRDFTQQEAAERLGIGRDTLRSYERDSSKIDYEMIEKIEELYKVPKDFIFFGNSTAFSVMLEESEEV